MVMPSMDAKLNPHAVQLPNLVEAVGVDGRFMGAIRPFPGMADVTIHGVPAPSAQTTITGISNVVFAKYVSIYKGNTGDAIKGIAYLADNPGGTGKSVYFAYRDSSNNSTDVVELEDLDSWDDFKVTSINEYDITSLGKYIYLVISGDTTSTVTQWQNKEGPYNKAYFWDFKINGWDKFVTGFDKRFMGLQPRRILGHPLNANDDGTFIADSKDCFAAQTYGSTGHKTPIGEYSYAVELVSRKHNLRSWMRIHSTTAPGTTSSALRYFIDEIKLPSNGPGTTHQIKANVNTNSCIINWGIPHVDGFRFWRTPVNDAGVDFNLYTPMGGFFYLVDEYLEKGTYVSGSANFFLRFDHDSIIDTVFGEFKTSWFVDSALIQQHQYVANLDAFESIPRLKRLKAYDGLLVGVTDVEEPASPGDDWDVHEQQPEALAWSTLVAPEPENFPPDQQYRVDDAAEKFYAMELAGDYLFGITNASVYRIARQGSILGINRLQFRLGGESRFGQTGVGNSLFIVTASGIKQIDGNSGAITSIVNLDRIILDDSEWASTLGSVHVEFDAQVGALIFLNTSKKEIYILWESTGAVTKLEDVPWTFITSGPDVLTDGAHRAYFITSDAQVHVIDGGREMGKRSMCGTTASETMNGTVTTASATNLIDTAATFPANCVGFNIHMLSGDLEGESAEITTRGSGTNLTVSGLSATTTIGDRYSVAPVVTKLTLPVMSGQGGVTDPFVRKVVTSISCSFSDLGGHTGTSDTNGKFRAGIKQMSTILGTQEADFNIIPDKTVVRVDRATTRPFPYLEFKGGNQDWELQSVLVHGVMSMSEAQSRQGTS